MKFTVIGAARRTGTSKKGSTYDFTVLHVIDLGTFQNGIGHRVMEMNVNSELIEKFLAGAELSKLIGKNIEVVYDVNIRTGKAYPVSVSAA